MKPIVGTNNKLIIQAQEEKTETGIIIPDQFKKAGTPKIATVVHITREDNEGKRPEVCVGDTVLISRGMPAEKFDYKGEEYYIIKEFQVLAVV
jgi:co-chaperonin GroES (HSP10)